jgi:hypothetical protein
MKGKTGKTGCGRRDSGVRTTYGAENRIPKGADSVKTGNSHHKLGEGPERHYQK